MPKSKKSLPDFKHRKASLTRKKPAENATSTTFQAKKIFLPNQPLKTAKSEPVTHRNQTLKDLIGKVKHYSPNVRKDSLMGMKELFSHHPDVIGPNFSSIFHTTIDLMMDEEKPVRSSLVTLYKTLLPRIGKEGFRPYSGVYCKYLCVAMTHIADAIRLHSIDFISVLLQHHPNVVSENRGQLLPLFLDILSPESRSDKGSKSAGVPGMPSRSLIVNPTTKMASFQSRHSILICLNQVILTFKNETLKKGNETSIQTSVFFGSDIALTKERAVPSYKEIVQLSSLLNPNLQILDKSNEKQNTTASTTTFELNTSEKFKEFVFMILPVLMECWLECSPAEVLSGNCSEDILKCMNEILTITANLLDFLRSLNPDDVNVVADRFEKEMHKYIFVYFPFTAFSSKESSGAIVANINALICTLSTYVYNPRQGDSQPRWFHNIFKYITEVLQSEPNSHMFANGTQLLTLIPTFWFSANIGEGRELLAQAFESYLKSSHPVSNHKKQSLLLLETIVQKFTEERVSGLQSIIDDETFWSWINLLPRFLWQAKYQSPEITSTILRILHRVGVTSPKLEGGHAKFDMIQALMQPLFFISNYSKKRQSTIQAYGPFLEYPAPVQKNIIDVYYHFSTITHDTLSSWLHCLSLPNVSEEVTSYAIDLLSHKQDSMNILDLISFYVALPVFEPSDMGQSLARTLDDTSRQKHAETVRKICAWHLSIQKMISVFEVLKILFSGLTIHRSEKIERHILSQIETISVLLPAAVAECDAQATDFLEFWTETQIHQESINIFAESILSEISKHVQLQEPIPKWLSFSILHIPGFYSELLNSLVLKTVNAETNTQTQTILSRLLEWPDIFDKNVSHKSVFDDLTTRLRQQQTGLSSLLQTALASVFGAALKSL